jgi:integrase
VVTIRTVEGDRRDVYLGKYDSPESRREYARVIAELATSPTATAAPTPAQGSGLTVDQMLLAFWEHAKQHYRTPTGEPTSEIEDLRRSLAHLQRLYGHTPAVEFGPRALAAVRQEMISADWCRTLINQRVNRVRRVFRWATSQELVPVTVHQALRTLAGLQKGRTTVRESKPVKPVDPAHVVAVLPHLSRHVRAMVEVQRLTGMRPGEVCALTFAEVDRLGEMWIYRPAQHKTAHRGKQRAVPLGPKARALLLGFVQDDKPAPAGFTHIELNNPQQSDARRVAADAYQEVGRDHDAELLRDPARPVVFLPNGCVVDPSAPVFSPVRERAERYKRLRAARKSKVQPSQLARKKPNPQCLPSAQYHPHAYTSAIAKACAKANVEHWHPNQLRHLHATEVRRRYGLEAAQATLGHSRADVTQVYAERDLALAAKVANEMG